ncbi:MAG: RNA methyltransferase [Eubacteriales bacterium]|nr:RNA methyltransferase [Eubacteriales bacterium]
MEAKKKKFIKELLTKSKARRESGLYIVDGPKMCKELKAYDIESLFVTKNFLESENAASCKNLLESVAYELVTEADMKQLSDTVTPQGIVALVKQKKNIDIKELLSESKDKTPLLFILEKLQDPGNLGTIVRAAEAAGVTGIVMSSDCADIYSPKVVRSTMGAIFRVPFIITDDLCSFVNEIKAGKYTEGVKFNIYAAHLKGAKEYDLLSYIEPTAVMIGNESKGLSDELTGCADYAVKIPMCGTVESLNAAMAAAIIMFEAGRQRRHK